MKKTFTFSSLLFFLLSLSFFNTKAQIIKVPIESVSLVGSLNSFSSTQGVITAAQTVQLSVAGFYGSTSVTVTVTGDFEVSSDGQTFSSSANFYFIPQGQYFPSQSLYVRYNPSTAGTHNGVITAQAGSKQATLNISGSASASNSVVEISNKFKLFPNPSADGLIYLQNSNNQAITSVFVTDILGNQVLSLGSSNALDLSSLSQGIYFVNITSSEEIWSEKVMIK